MDHASSWHVHDRFLTLHSRWLTLIGEHLEDHQGNRLEYWRIEKADSVIVLPLQADHLLLPAPSYRPGVGTATWDFPGGRIAAGQTPEQAAIAVLQRELGVTAIAPMQLTALNADGWAINSSFSNQRLYGFVAHLNDQDHPQPDLPPDVTRYPVTPSAMAQLLQKLTCLQCRAVLLEWWLGVSTSAED